MVVLAGDMNGHVGSSNAGYNGMHGGSGYGDNANLESVHKFCYLGDMLSADRDANAAVETGIKIGWNKFRQLIPMVTNEDIVVDKGLSHSILPHRGGMTGQSAPTVLACWSL